MTPGANPNASSRFVFNVEGMHCANCARAIERAVSALQGVQRISVNAATNKASVDWDPQQLALSKVFEAVRKAGFKPVPIEGEEAAAAEKAERRTALKRIGIAGLGMMQTMMFVYALYAGGNHGVDEQIAQYLRLAGMLLTTPVLVYSGAPFFVAALNDLRRRRLGMDVPVSVALLLAFVASVVNTLRGTGQIYYDSVTMFIFLLSLGRFAEMTVRQRSLSASEAFARSVPATVLKIGAGGHTQRVPLGTIVPGDRLLIPRGAIIPVDGTLDSSHALIDESLVNGESRPVAKSAAQEVLGGSINSGHGIEIVCRVPADRSTLAGIVSLLRQAAAERPRSVAAADRAASVFSLVTLLLAASVAIYWSVVNPANMMTATLAVLVVTCPCALSLATPATFAAATSRLARLGMLVVKPESIERLAIVDTVVLDKTGTLTEGTPVARVERVREGFSATRALAIAAALERASEHPLSAAFLPFAQPEVRAENVQELVGQGLQGTIDGALWRIGSPRFAALPSEVETLQHGASVVLGDAEGMVAVIEIRDEVSEGAREAVAALKRQDLKVAIASGDAEGAVVDVARSLGIEELHARMGFRDKMDFVRDKQAQGHSVLMVGDGINDGPVLAAANVSCALTRGSAVAQSAADLLLLNQSLRALAEGTLVARKARHVVRQNLWWALVYNVTSVPLAAAGWVPPWIAALGMSISSLAVVLNAARLASAGAKRRPAPSAASATSAPSGGMRASGASA